MGLVAISPSQNGRKDSFNVMLGTGICTCCLVGVRAQNPPCSLGKDAYDDDDGGGNLSRNFKLFHLCHVDTFASRVVAFAGQWRTLLSCKIGFMIARTPRGPFSPPFGFSLLPSSPLRHHLCFFLLRRNIHSFYR